MPDERKLRCPLCLKELTEDDKLYACRLDLDEDDKQQKHITVECGGEDFVKKIAAFGSKYINVVSDTDTMVCVSHVNCKADNLFWSPDPASDNGGSIILPNGKGRRSVLDFNCFKTNAKIKRTVDHWVLNMLRVTFNHFSTHPKMWFPFPLLRATGKSSLVELAGSKQVGKTIIAMQLAYKEHYTNAQSIGRLNISDYVFLHDKKDFKDELAIRTDWGRRPFTRPSSTAPTPGDVRAIFIDPPKIVNASPNGLNGNNANGYQNHKARIDLEKTSKWVKKASKPTLVWLWDAIKEFWAAFWGKDETPAEKDKNNISLKNRGTLSANQLIGDDKVRHWHSVVFYDTAGESQEEASLDTKRIRRYTDKLAVCIDAQDLFDEVQNQLLDADKRKASNESLRCAYGRIKLLSESHDNKAACLLVTKLDSLPDELLFSNSEGTNGHFSIRCRKELKELVERIPQDKKEESELDQMFRRLLIQWLSHDGDSEKTRLIEQIEDTELIDRVFFVWTEGLPKMQGIRVSPIEKFYPEQGFPGDTIKIVANDTYFNSPDIEANYTNPNTEQQGLNAVESIGFGGVKAEILERSSKELQIRVPDNAKTGFINITIKDLNGNDEATSETVFTVKNDRSRYVKPKSFGMLRFLFWCVGKPVNEIVQLRQPSQEAASLETEQAEIY